MVTVAAHIFLFPCNRFTYIHPKSFTVHRQYDILSKFTKSFQRVNIKVTSGQAARNDLLIMSSFHALRTKNIERSV
jgi:hypothetical protein